jgi:hypothetical protein
MRRVFYLFTSAFAASAIVFAQTNQPAGIPPPPVLPDGSSTAAVVFPNGQSVTMWSRLNQFPLVGAAAGDTLNVKLRVPTSFAPLVMNAQALDGGIVSASAANLTVAADGTASLQFQTGNQPGLYRILLYVNRVLVTSGYMTSGRGDPSGLSSGTDSTPRVLFRAALLGKCKTFADVKQRLQLGEFRVVEDRHL